MDWIEFSRTRLTWVNPRLLAVLDKYGRETFPRDVSDREQLHDELRRMALRVAAHLAESGQVARTVTTKLRYPDFSIRSRSTTLAAGLADGERIGRLACDLLDRALADRPGALRLVGVTVSKIEDFEQLALEAG